MMRKFDLNQGITLIELISLIAIISILLVVSVPVLTDYMDRFRVKFAAETLFQDLIKARTEAVKQGSDVYVTFSTGDTWCYGFSTGSSCNCSIANNCNLGATSYPQALQTTMTVSGFTGNQFYFEGSHGAASQTGNITFTTFGQISPLIRTSVNRLGSFGQCSTDVSGYSSC